MLALLCLLALAAGPTTVLVMCRRTLRRARAAGIRGGTQEERVAQMRPLITTGESLAVVAALALVLAALATLAVMAVLHA